LAFAGETDQDKNVTDSRIDTEPSFQANGAIVLGVKGGHWIRLNWATLAEVDPNGNVLHSEDLTKQTFKWTDPIENDLEDERGHHTGHQFPHVNFSESLNNGAWFNISAWVITTDVTVGNVTAKRNSVKFNIYISNWTFANSSDTLVLSAGIDGVGGDESGQDLEGDGHKNDGHVNDGPVNETYHNETGHNETDYHDYHGDFQEHHLRFGIGFLSSPNQAIYDGSFLGPVNVTTTFTGKPVVSWSFVAFANNVSYDPVMGGGMQIVPSLLLFVLLALSTFFGSR